MLHLLQYPDDSTSESDHPVTGWLQNSYTGKEQKASYNISVGVTRGAETLQQHNMTFRVEVHNVMKVSTATNCMMLCMMN